MCRSPRLSPLPFTPSHAESLAAAADAHLTKPVERNDLVEAIARWAKRPSDPCAEPLPPEIASLRATFVANRWQDLHRLHEALECRDFTTAGHHRPQLHRNWERLWSPGNQRVGRRH